ncbi:hypothetical protein [Alkalicoccobacillus murimartini]|uniref:Uncharacterized protein n=1 Tax=Alkalicoccobacillus murimartini TaxID=171685 RepID=A0ABT9YL31_9BACI|nr:hypothetical protein [Alkalicoccobacillus murimartini]MDQ0207912.1 hypothetical protein [Alkalicoccobacillus murimartini]
MTRITRTPSLRMNRVLQHRLQNAVSPNSVAKIDPVAPTARTTEVVSNESANYLYDFERNSWVSRFRQVLRTFYQKERQLWLELRAKKRGILQFERFVDAWNETATQIIKLEKLGLSSQSDLRVYLDEQSETLNQVGVTVEELSLVLHKQTLIKAVNLDKNVLSDLQTIKYSLYENYHHLFSITVAEQDHSPYERQPVDLKGLLFEQHG